MKKNTLVAKHWLDKHYPYYALWRQMAEKSNDEVITETKAYFYEKDKSYYKNGSKKIYPSRLKPTV